MKFALLALLPILQVVTADSWGPAYSLGPTHNGASIIEAVTNFTPGKPPTNPQDALFLWPGISNGTSGLIQSGADQLKNQQAYCGATATQWCVSASYFGVGGQFSGPLKPVEGSAVINIHYKLQTNRRTWDQTVTVNGAVISTLQSQDGPLLNGGWGTGTECQSNCRGTIDTQLYTNTVITLDKADPLFKNTLGKGAGVVASDLLTADAGKTWTIASIRLPVFTAP